MTAESSNCSMKPVYEENGNLHLCLFVNDGSPILKHKELRYYYDHNPENLTWQKILENQRPRSIYYDIMMKKYVLNNEDAFEINIRKITPKPSSVIESLIESFGINSDIFFLHDIGFFPITKLYLQ